jgi:uncharacterized membrane protein YuzA (DUF378 family)
MKALHIICWILLVVGGLNWGLIGIANIDAVAYLGTAVARIIYVLVGLAAIVSIFTHKKDCKACVSPSGQAM